MMKKYAVANRIFFLNIFVILYFPHPFSCRCFSRSVRLHYNFLSEWFRSIFWSFDNRPICRRIPCPCPRIQKKKKKKKKTIGKFFIFFLPLFLNYPFVFASFLQHNIESTSNSNNNNNNIRTKNHRGSESCKNPSSIYHFHNITTFVATIICP